MQHTKAQAKLREAMTSENKLQHIQAEAKRVADMPPEQKTWSKNAACSGRSKAIGTWNSRPSSTTTSTKCCEPYKEKGCNNCCGQSKVAVSLSRNYSSQIYEVYSGNTQHSKECKKYIFVRTRVHLLLLQRSLPNFKGFPSTGIYSLQINVKLYHHIGGAW